MAASFSLRAQGVDPEIKQRLLAALPPDVSFVCVETRAVAESKFVATFVVLFPLEVNECFQAGDKIAEAADAGIVVLAEDRDGRTSFGLLVHSPCPDMKTFSEKLNEIAAGLKLSHKMPKFSVENGRLSADGKLVARELSPHILLFADGAALNKYAASGVPPDIRPDLASMRGRPVFGCYRMPDGKTCVFGAGFVDDEINVDIVTQRESAEAASAAAALVRGTIDAQLKETLSNAPALAEKLGKQVSVTTDGNKVMIAFNSDSCTIMMAMVAPAMMRARAAARAKQAEIDAAAGKNAPAAPGSGKPEAK